MATKIRFIENKEEYGVDYDYPMIRRKFRKLKTPENRWDPCEVPWESVAYDIELSTRSTGKTTQAILWGMTVRSEYPRFSIVLLRCREDQIMPKNVSTLMDVIRSYDDGRYVRQLTNGRWNDIWHDRNMRAFRYVNRDERGDIYEKDEEPFLWLMAINLMDEYKSGKVLPNADLIIFDEFIAELYYPTDFENLMNIIKTIFRDRLSGRVCMMANTIKPASPWYRELLISKELRSLKLGDPGKRVVTELNTPLWLHVFDTPTEHRRRVSSWYFGFKNPALAAIRGDGELWVYKKYQKIITEDTDEIVSRKLKIDTGDELLGIDFVQTEDRGLVVNVHPISKTLDTDIILTNGEIWDKQHRRGRGYGPICDMWQLLDERGKIYFSDAETMVVYREYLEIADDGEIM